MVILKNVLENELKINCDVPQGCVLSPTLFIMYINTIYDSQINSSIIKYAEDTCLLFSNTYKSVYTKATSGLNLITWKLNTKN